MRMKYQRFIAIWKLQSKYCAKPMLFILGLLAVIQGGLVAFYYLYRKPVGLYQTNWDVSSQSMVLAESTWFGRFEVLLERYQIKLTFLLGLLAILFVLFLIHHRQNSGSISDITITRLPMKQTSIVYIKVLHNASMIYLYVIAQFFLILIWNGIYQLVIPDHLQMSNSMYLSLLRWDFLYKVYPFYDGLALCANILTILAIAATLVYIQEMREVHYLGIVIYIVLLVYSFITVSWVATLARCVASIVLMLLEHYEIRKEINSGG